MNFKCNSFPEEMVTIPLSLYTEMVCQIQMLEDTQEIERLKRECEATEAKRVETRLASLGYMDATPDEAFDEYAVEALEDLTDVEVTDAAVTAVDEGLLVQVELSWQGEPLAVE